MQCNAPSPYQDRQANAASRSALLCCDPTPISSPFIFRWHGIAWKKNQQSLLNSADRAFIFPCFHIPYLLLYLKRGAVIIGFYYQSAVAFGGSGRDCHSILVIKFKFKEPDGCPICFLAYATSSARRALQKNCLHDRSLSVWAGSVRMNCMALASFLSWRNGSKVR